MFWLEQKVSEGCGMFKGQYCFSSRNGVKNTASAIKPFQFVIFNP